MSELFTKNKLEFDNIAKACFDVMRGGKKEDVVIQSEKPVASKETVSVPQQIDESVSKKHMEWAAKSIHNVDNYEHRKLLAGHFSHFFAAHNSKFDHVRFHKAAGAWSEPPQEATPVKGSKK